MSTRGAAKQPEGSEIDLTPMLDVVFIMLIFFIVTASFIKEPGMEVKRPEAETRQSVKNQNILIAINANNEIWVDRKKIDPRFLKSVIERMHAENPLGAVVIQADEDSNAGTYAKAWDAAKKAGVKRISLAADEK